LLAHLAGTPSQSGDTGGLVSQEYLQQAAGDGQADPFGLSGTGEVRQPIRGQGHPLALLPLKVAELLMRLVKLLPKVLQASPVLVAVEGAGDRVCLAVEGLSGDSAQARLVGDVAVVAVKDRVRTGKVLTKR
jgi:hypothetical protein